MKCLSAYCGVVVAGAIAVSACGGGDPCPNPASSCTTTTTTTTSFPPPPVTEVFVGAGDIGMCGPQGNPAATARLLDTIEGTVFTAGDNAYPQGSAQDFRNCYDPTWGRHRDRTRPAPGNHDYETLNGTPYYDYFGESSGPRGFGYYSFELGAWHILSLNSNIATQAGSPQYAFVTRDLASNRSPCTMAYWHHPLYTSGQNGPNGFMRDIYRALYDANADLIVTGHDHLYEKFLPQNADGDVDTARGIRQFIIGTGGAQLTLVVQAARNSEVRVTGSFGVLKLTLTPNSYDAAFIQANGTIADFTTGRCH